MEEITWQQFEDVDIRVGTIVDVQDFPEAKKPAYKLMIDLGQDIGIKTSSAQITRRYTKEMLLGSQVLCVVNFPPRQVGPFLSEVLTTGFVVDEGDVILVRPYYETPNGTKLA